MKINSMYKIIKRENEFFLTNIKDGDVYEINDVTLAIFEMCEQINDFHELINSIYTKFQSSTDNYSKIELEHFVSNLISHGFIVDN